MAKKNLPNIPLYIGDWERDCTILDIASEGAWLRIIFKMWLKGKQNSIKIPTKSLQKLWRCSEEQVQEILIDIKFNEVAEIEESQGFTEFTCRRFVKENKISKIRSSASKGQKEETKPKQNLNKHPHKNEQNSDNDNDNEIDNDIKNENEVIKKPKINFQEIVDIFNSVCSELPDVIKITPQREKTINARIEEYGLEEIGKAFQLVSQSDFLNGKSTEGWKASFDWVINPNNFIKILEGKYKNNEKRNSNSKKQVKYSDDYKRKILEELQSQ